MGAQNVAKVFANWRHLSHREARALLFMANTALDADKPPKYFGGWQAVAEALGLSDAASARRMTMQVFAALRAAGATVSSGQARMNVRAEYALSLEPEFTFEPRGSGRAIAWVQVPRSPIRMHQKDTQMDEPKRHPVVHEKDTHQGVPKVQNRMHQKDTPMNTEEPWGGIHDEEIRGIQSGGDLSLTNEREPERQTGSFSEPSMDDGRRRQALEEWGKSMGKEKAS